MFTLMTLSNDKALRRFFIVCCISNSMKIKELGNKRVEIAVLIRVITGSKKFKREINNMKGKRLYTVGGVDGTRTRDPRRDRPVF